MFELKKDEKGAHKKGIPKLASWDIAPFGYANLGILLFFLQHSRLSFLAVYICFWKSVLGSMSMLSHHHCDFMAARLIMNDVAVYQGAVNLHGQDTTVYALGIGDADAVFGIAELALY